MPTFKREFVTLEFGKKRRPTLEKAAFHLTITEDGVECTTIFTVSDCTRVDFDSLTNTPLYKSKCGTKTVTNLLNDDKSQMRWIMADEDGKSIMATGWRALPVMAYDICPHCVFSCPCLCGAMTWRNDNASYTMTAMHANAKDMQVKEMTEEHVQDALTMRYGLYQAVAYSLIDATQQNYNTKQVAKLKANARNKYGQMLVNHTAAYKQVMARRMAAAASAAVLAAAAEDSSSAALAGRINAATDRIKAGATRVAAQIQNIASTEWTCANADARTKDDNFINWATQRLKAVYDVLFGDNVTPSVTEEYEAILNDCVSKINDARGYVSAAKRHRAEADAAAAAKVLEAVEAAVVAEVSGEAVATLQARVRACLLFRRVEDVRRAAALLASTRYELRTIARLRNDEECGICLSRFDYHAKSPLTAPCSNMPLCYACCRDYSGKVCLCGIDHFDRKLWRSAV